MTDANQFIRENFMSMSDKELGEQLGLSTKAVKNRRHRMELFKDTGHLNYSPESAKNLFDELEVALEELGSVDRVTVNKTRTEKDNADGEDPTVTETTRTSVTLRPDSGDVPRWNPISQAAPTIIKPTAAKKVERDLKVAVCLPDPQIGYRRNVTTAEPDNFHDERAMEVGLQLIRDLKPDLIVNLGDFMDLPQFGRYVQEPGFALTTQLTLDRSHRYLAEQRANAPHAEIVYIEGNHDKRLQNAIVQNLGAAFGIRRAQAPTEHPVLSIPFLLRLEELGVKYVPGYPAGEYYINDGLKCIHGKQSGRGVARKTLNDEKVSTITGHSHHVEVTYRTVNTKTGPVRRVAATLGCLCRTDGPVPGYHASIDYDGNAVTSHQDWQQSVGIVHYEEGGTFHRVTPVLIDEGQAVWGGKTYAV